MLGIEIFCENSVDVLLALVFFVCSCYLIRFIPLLNVDVLEMSLFYDLILLILSILEFLLLTRWFLSNRVFLFLPKFVLTSLAFFTVVSTAFIYDISAADYLNPYDDKLEPCRSICDLEFSSI